MKTMLEIDNKKKKNEQMNKCSYNDMKINNESQTSKRINKKVPSINRRNHSV